MNEIKTEKINENTTKIDKQSTKDILYTFNKEDQIVIKAVNFAIENISNLIDEAVINFKDKGRLFYVGAGTSGRLGVLDASECPPTFGVDPFKVIGIIAGGDLALRNPIEGAEDDFEKGKLELEKYNINEFDTVIGIAASGNTPYVCGALEYAKSVNALTGGISCNENANIFKYSIHKIFLNTGAEVISGSTRLKAGTATKLALNMISSTLMIKIGKVYKNLMVDVKPSNKKLVKRALNLIIRILNCSQEKAIKLLEDSNKNVKLAVIMGKLDVNLNEAKKLLKDNDDFLHKIID